MKAILIIKTGNGFAVAPYSGAVPVDFVQDMSVATKLSSYSYSGETVLRVLEDYFEPAETTPLKVAA